MTTYPNEPWPGPMSVLWEFFKVLWDWLFLDVLGLGRVLE